jgi:serine/threonine protein kinase
LFLLVTGGVPFWGDSEAQLFSRIQSGNYNLPGKGKTYTKKLKNLLSRIFSVNVSDRITADAILKDPWCYKKPKQ